MNTVNLTGVLQRFEDKGTWVRGSIRVQNNMKNKQTDKYESSFFDFKMFGKTAELFLRFHSERTGKNIAITGNLVQETWEKDGQKRSNVVVMVQKCDLPPYDTIDEICFLLTVLTRERTFASKCEACDGNS